MLKMRKIVVGLGLLFAFAVWTIVVSAVDVQAIGPQGSTVGFATVNGFVHNLTGVHWWLYTVTDWLGLVPFAVAFGFAITGLAQWIRRKHLWKVDLDILVLDGFYVVVLAAYLLFESVVINYRPVLINGFLEVSYPSSTTMLAMCVMPTAAMQFYNRIQHCLCKQCMVFTCITFTIFMVVGRVLSGVHWISDIIGGILFSVGGVLLYAGIIEKRKSKY